jgi:hypothetical protein
MSQEQFNQADKSQLTSDLNAAPVSAVFKLAHNAKTDSLRALAEQVFAKRYGQPK